MIKARHAGNSFVIARPSKPDSYSYFMSYHIIEFDLGNPNVYAKKKIEVEN